VGALAVFQPVAHQLRVHSTRDADRSEEHTSELQSHLNLVCRLLLEKKKQHSVLELSDRHQKHPYQRQTRPSRPSEIFFFYCSAHPPDLHSFPTRRSSD